METRNQDLAAKTSNSESIWTLTIEGEGAQPVSYQGTAIGAEKWADGWIRDNYDTSELNREVMRVVYYLNSEDGQHFQCRTYVTR